MTQPANVHRPLSSSSRNNCLEAVGRSRAQRRWSFEIIASLRAKPLSVASDVIAAIDFDETGSKFATAGIARKIKVCSYASIVNPDPLQGKNDEQGDEDDDFAEERTEPHEACVYRGNRKRRRKDGNIHSHDEVCLRVICTPAKLSSLKWRPLGSNVVGCGDYDGVVTEWDIEQGMFLCERYEHSGQRIWSVDYSTWFPTLCASASNDGTTRLWTQNCDRSIGVIRSPRRNSICCAQFNASGPHRISIACADSNVYLYDLRRLDSSFLCLRGHGRAASYVKFLSDGELVSASVDSTVKLWDISNVSDVGSWKKSLSTGEGRLLRTFSSHRNVKNFVGLGVSKWGLVSCGSETNEVFVYEKSHTEPVWRMEFPVTLGRKHGSDSWVQTACGGDGGGTSRVANRGTSFVGAICWREQEDDHTLVTANSDGTVQMIRVSWGV